MQLYYQTAILGRRDLGAARRIRARGFEMTLVRMLAFRPAGGAALSTAGAAAARAAGAAAPSPGSAPIVRPASAGPIDPVQWARVIGDLDVSGARASWQPIARCVEHRGNTLRLAIDPKVARTPPQVERLAQALAKYLGSAVKLEFVDGDAAGRDAEPARRAAQRGGARCGAPRARGRSRRCAK